MATEIEALFRSPHLVSSLLSWYADNKRLLPWRDASDPYRVWISEVMLQQTQVKTALPYFEAFIERFPTVSHLAAASEDTVLSLWSGLGYYSRARNLLAAARMICRDHQNQFPTHFDQAIRLPGVGRYTAGAVLSIAYDLAFPVLDGNVRRVLARFLKIEQPLKGQLERALWDTLSKVVQEDAVRPRVGEFNQALMELGALICTPRNPSCSRCPLAPNCRARRAGIERDLPVRSPAKPRTTLHFVVAVIRSGDRYLLRCNHDGPFLRGLWELPRVDGVPQDTARTRFQEEHGLKLKLAGSIVDVTHSITFRRLHFHALKAELLDAVQSRNFDWGRPESETHPMPSYVRKIISAFEA